MRVSLSASVRRRLGPLDKINRVAVPAVRSSPLFTAQNPKYHYWILITADNETERRKGRRWHDAAGPDRRLTHVTLKIPPSKKKKKNVCMKRKRG